MDRPTAPEVYICYSSEDRKEFEELLTHLQPAIDNGSFDYSSHEKISGGKIWREEIEAAIASAKVAVLLVSGEFFVSPSVTDVELPLLLKAARRGDLTLLWFPQSASSYEMTEIEIFEPIHPRGQPLNGLEKPEREGALVEISKKILSALEERRSLANRGGQVQAQADEQDLQPEARREAAAKGERRVPARTVLYLKIAVIILAGVGLIYLIVHAYEPRKSQEPPPPPLENRVINISVKARPLQEIFKEVARQIGAVPAVDPGITGTLSVSIVDGEVKDFMNEICHEMGKCTWKIQPGNPPALVVLPPKAVPLKTGGE